jgi:ATP-dependent DNA helicase PIF1
MKLDEIYEQGSEGVVPCRFRCGSAGTGKTYLVRQEIAANPKFGILTAVTGIAAVNLGAITLNSVLRYFDTRSLEEAFSNGYLQKTILKLAEDEYEWLVIDESSMLAGEQLDVIYQAMKQVNEILKMQGKPPLGIFLVGDPCQLPPIKAKWFFEAECWEKFEKNTERLTKCWRQTDAKFLEAVNHIRSGRGMVGATMLSQLGVEFVKHADTSFTGTTIIAKNEAVDNFNWLCHSKLPGVPVTVVSDRWMTLGRGMPSEWKNIPSSLSLKPGAYVMILSNDTPEFTYVNGDCGNVVSYDKGNGAFTIRLIRNMEEVEIGRITRHVTQKEPPDELLQRHPGVGEDALRELDREPGMPYWNPNLGRNGTWVVGAITFYPLRLAYASTVHRTQGLTLDRVQIDLNQHFMTQSAMCYVAISRCKTPQGLRIIGSPSLLGSRVHTDPLVQRWL